MTQKWGVVGGGMLGMSLAMWLRDQGHDVTIIEADEQLGGLAAPWTIGDVVWDRHYHVILNADSHLLTLLERLGLTESIEWVETKTGVYAKGRLYSVSNSMEYLRFPPLRLIDKARMAWTIVYASRVRNWKALEQIPVETWLRKHSGDRAFEEFWLPLLRSKLGDNYERTSAAFIWATIQRLYAARRQGLKKEVFGYVTGGYSRILSVLGQSLEDAGVDIRLGSPVESIAPLGDGSVEVKTPEESLRFDRTVVTLPAPLASRLIAGVDDLTRKRMTNIAYQGIVCASMLTENELSEYYVTNITDGWLPFTGVIEMTALVDRKEVGGQSLVYLPRYTSQTDDVVSQTDEEVEESFVGALEKMYETFNADDVGAFRVSRVSHVFPIPTLGYSERIPSIRVADGVFAVNSSHILNGTLNVNETLQLAARVLPILTGSKQDEGEMLSRPVAPLAVGGRQ